MSHRNARLTVHARLLIVERHRAGWPQARIAEQLGVSRGTVKKWIERHQTEGPAGLEDRSSRPHTTHPAFGPERAERLREMLHRSPREFGKPTSLWTLALTAEVSFEEEITEERVSAETVRATLERLGVRWLRAKRWITSPDPEYERKKGAAIG